jgi:hypothetical protein
MQGPLFVISPLRGGPGNSMLSDAIAPYERETRFSLHVLATILVKPGGASTQVRSRTEYSEIGNSGRAKSL